MNSNFVDYVKIHVRSGKGGAGSAHLHREKFIAKGGPDGGDGGRGGHVILKANAQLWTLLPLRYTKHLKAENGGNGGKNRLTGADGKDIYIEVPVGTVAKDEEGNILGEVIEDGEELILLEGGKGGRGNWHFKSPTRQTPRYAQPGIPGKEMWTVLELKVLADVGLVGFPNAGKSTLLSVVSAAKPKIANYEFTTLEPNLGIVSYREGLSFIMADIPGIIEGAAEGKGIGHRFLRHIERNSVLLFMIPADAKDYWNEYNVLRNELQQYNPDLLDKEHYTVISKADILDEELKEEIRKEFPEDFSLGFISAITGQGIPELKDELWRLIN